MSISFTWIRDTRGASAAEFAMVLPLLLLFLFGIIDAGRFLWEVNRAEKATQFGVRYAAVTNMVPSGLAAYSFATGAEQVPPGTPVPTSAWSSVTCTSAGCANSGAGPEPGFNATAFNNIGDRMRLIYPQIANTNFSITYRNVGLGYAGDPYGADVAPQVTIEVGRPNPPVTPLSFTPITTLLFATMTMPPTSSTMTLEDGVGTVSN